MSLSKIAGANSAGIGGRAAHVFQESKHEQGKVFQIVCHDELRRWAAGRSSHGRLVGSENVDDLVGDCVPSILELGLHRPLYGLVCEEGGDGDLIRRGVDLRDAVRDGKGSGDDPDPPLAWRIVSAARRCFIQSLAKKCGGRAHVSETQELTAGGGVEHSSLEDDKRLRERVLDGELDAVALIERDGRQGEEICRSDEEVSVEGRELESARSSDAHHGFEGYRVGQDLAKLVGKLEGIL